MTLAVYKFKPNWVATIGERVRGGYNYELTCPLQPNNKVTGWRRCNKTELSKRLRVTTKRLNDEVLKIPKHMRSTANIQQHKERLSKYAALDKERKNRGN